MTIEQIKAKYGTLYMFFKAYGLSQGYYAQFNKHGYIPIKTQERFEVLTKGEFKADYNHCKQDIK